MNTLTPRPAWLTPQGHIDLQKFPIEPALRQSLDEEERSFYSGVGFLRSMVSGGRLEAGVYLLGLLRHYADDLERLKVVANALGEFRTRQAVSALVSEFYRIESSNRTRGYLNEVLKALSRFPRSLAQEPLLNLAEDGRFSYRMKRKFEDLAGELSDREEFIRAAEDQTMVSGF